MQFFKQTDNLAPLLALVLVSVGPVTMLKCCTFFLEQIPAEKKASALGGWGGYAEWVSSPEKRDLCESFANNNISKSGATAHEYYKVIDFYYQEIRPLGRGSDAAQYNYSIHRIAKDLSYWREVIFKLKAKKNEATDCGLHAPLHFLEPFDGVAISAAIL